MCAISASRTRPSSICVRLPSRTRTTPPATVIVTSDAFALYTSAEYGLYTGNICSPSVRTTAKSARIPGFSMPNSCSACSALAPPRVAAATICAAGNRPRSWLAVLWLTANRRI